MTPAEQERMARLELSLLAEPGDPRIADLVAQVGPVQAREMLRAHLGDARLVADTEGRARELNPAAVLDHAAQVGARWIVPGDAEWPAGLTDLGSVGPISSRGGIPLGLWVKGVRLDRLAPRVAIVGSRAATTYGTATAATIAAECATAGWVVVSGGAYGVDEAAHRAVLAARAPTIVALAHGLDRVYPVGNTAMVEACVERGALISELAPGSAPMPMRFLARNRVIAAMAAGTVVVEANVRSGALNTANWASTLGRQLLAVPGPTTSSVSSGTNGLIRSGAATLATCGADVIEVLSPAGEGLVEEPRAPERRRDRLDARTRQLLEAVPLARATDLGRIAATAGLSLGDAQRRVRHLEDAALVVFESGGWRVADAARARAAGEPPGHAGEPT